ncbi:FAD-dependent oxidoreductase [Pseudoalteromonas sp. OOF1S-7]|uniref:NAD(P)/FAD-dependent oxidoreductase n=1 Tax=Pseudoalteromonas sp. OOF1S-7 TaxID=2917757 RepID=UPI001EF7441F|nr:FAD-dependent oxidoreductase [Pseudoalteromonas sp. OOF1S-7]MCG7537122.1 FAD-binding oxidoreductase [Pseudoalteromonas sp. OOF1S-7]
MKYVIIGNGIIALSSAFRLLQKCGSQDEIVIVGPADRVGSATLAAAAMQNSFAEIGAHSLKSDEDFFHFELSHKATREWPAFERDLIAAAGENLPKDCSQCEIYTGGCFEQGTYVINNTATDELDDKNFKAILQALEDFNEQHMLVDPADIPNYYPSQHKRATQAVYIPNEGWLNPRLVLEKLDNILANDDRVTVIDAKVTHLEAEGGQIKHVVTEGGECVSGDEYLLAAGAPTQSILENSKLDIETIKMFYGIGVSLEIVSPGYPHTKCIRTPNRGGACGVYTVPFYLGPGKSKEHIVIGASNYLSPEPVYHGRLISIEHLMRAATEEINGHFYNAQLVRTNVGWRPTSQDTFPLIGRSSLRNLTIATGTKRDGFHMSPVLSEVIADMLLHNPVDTRFSYFHPERELIKNVDRETGIDIVVESLMSEQYQHDYRPSNIRMNQQVRNTYRQDIEALHDKVGAVDWGIPPELVNMYRRGFAKVK